MTTKINIPDRLFIVPKYLEYLNEIFDKYCPNAEIWAYGSRIDGTAHEGSDLDLVVKDFHSTTAKLYELRQLINDSKIPILVDIYEFDKLPQSFQKEIERDYIVIRNQKI